MLSQRLQMFQHREIRIHEPLHTVRDTTLLLPRQFSGRYRTCDALLKAHICKAVDCYIHQVD